MFKINKKQIEVEKNHLKLEKEALQELKTTYEKALGDIQERVKALQSDEVLESKIRQLNYQKALETQISGILDVLKTDNTVTINKYLTKAYENGFIGTLYNMQNEEIPLALGIDQKQVLTSISKKIENMTFADRTDTNMNDFKKKIKAEITRGIANNSKYNEIARNLDNVTKEGINSSYRIARTEMGRVSQESKFDCMQRAKANGADIVKQWDSTMDGRTRDAHARLDGQVKELEEPFEIEVDGQTAKAMYPMGFGIASMDINCRCVILERARWAVEDELSGKSTFTKAVRNKDGMTEIKEFNTSSYNAFKKDFFKWQEEIKEKATEEVTEKVLHTIAQGKNIIGEFKRRANEFDFDIEDVINYQGYDGLPKVVEYEEFEKAMKESNFYAERTYSANTQEILDEYRNQLYNGKWYVDCSTGGSQYGKGMYCAASYDINNNKQMGGISWEMTHYQLLNKEKGNPFAYTEAITLDKSAKILELPKHEDKMYISNLYSREYMKKYCTTEQKDHVYKYIEALEKMDKLEKEINGNENVDWEEFSKKFEPLKSQRDTSLKDGDLNGLLVKARQNSFGKDPGVLAVEMGYDAINAVGHGTSGSYTVILNRTKVIFCKGGSIYGN